MPLDSEIKKKLSAVLDEYDKAVANRQKAVEKSKSEHEKFIEEFKRLRTEVIRPVMEEFGVELRQRGHEYEIEERDETHDYEGRTLSAHITMTVYPKDIERNEFTKRFSDTPYVWFHASTYEKKIHVGSSNIMTGRGGSGGPTGEYEITQVNHNFVEQQVARGLERIFGPTWGSN